MDKTIAVIVAALVLFIAAAAVGTVFVNGLGDFGNTTREVEDSGCEYQQEQYFAQDAPEETLSSRCKGEDWQDTQLSIQAMNQLNS